MRGPVENNLKQLEFSGETVPGCKKATRMIPFALDESDSLFATKHELIKSF